MPIFQATDAPLLKYYYPIDNMRTLFSLLKEAPIPVAALKQTDFCCDSVSSFKQVKRQRSETYSDDL